jgi:hypothetical protein
MAFEERNTWIAAATTLIAPVVYAAVILGRASGAPLTEVAYVGPMLWTIGATIVGTIVAIIAGAIFSAISAEIRAREFSDRSDERDKQIERRGEFVGFYVLGAGVLATLGLTMAEVDHFWIANTIYMACAVSSFVSSVVKIVIYRRGF